MYRTGRLRWFAASLAVTGALLAGCGEDSAESEHVSPALAEDSGVEGIKKITLTEEGQARVELQTTPVAASDDGLMIPYSAVIYDPQGGTWAFVGDAAERVYQREAVTIDRIDGDQVFLSDGPDEGTPVVSVGAMMLYGAELGMSH